MRLIERDGELASLSGLFAKCRDGRGGVAVVTGPVAIGKTALLHAFGERAIAGGAVFLKATASCTEQSLPFGVVGQLLTAACLPPNAAERARRLLEAGELAAPMPGGHADDFERLNGVVVAVLPGLCEILLGLSERDPVVIGVDDAHYADASSLEFLLYLARRLGSNRILLVLGERAGGSSGYQRFHAELLRQPHCQHMRIKALSQFGLAEMLADRMDLRYAHQLAPVFHRVSGGNPLLLRGLLEDYQVSAKSTPDELIPGEAFSQAVLSCLYRCEVTALIAARALAVLGEQSSPTLLREVLGLDPESTAQAIETLNAIGLLGDGRFRHDDARMTVLRTILPKERAALHARVAEELHNQGAPAATLARHLIATDRVEAPWVVPTLREAAEQALDGDEVALAIECLRAALGAGADEPERTAIKATLVRAQWRIDPLAAAGHLPELSAAALKAGSSMEWRDVRHLIGYLLWFCQPELAVEVLDAVESRGGGGMWTRRDARNADGLDLIRVWIGYVYPDLLGRFSLDLDACLAALAGSVRCTPVRAAGLLNSELAQAHGDTLTSAEQILQASRLDDDTKSQIAAALKALVHAGKLDEADYWCAAALEEAESRRAPMWQAFFSAYQASIDIRRGRMAAAERSARTALALVPPRSWGVAVSAAIAGLVLATTALGKYEDAAAYLGVPVPEDMFQSIGALEYLQARGRYYLARDRPYAALDDFYTCEGLMTKWKIDLATIVPWRTEAAWAHIRLGGTGRARELLEEELSRLQPDHDRPRGNALRALAALREPACRPALLDEAVELLEKSGDRYALALALADLGSARCALGDDDEGRAATNRAREIATQECGVELPMDDLPREPETLWEESTPALESRVAASAHAHGSVAELTDAELRVAALAAQGHTNRQIASTLFITASTVEQHLTRVYRKLKVNRRTDLPSELMPGVSAQM